MSCRRYALASWIHSLFVLLIFPACFNCTHSCSVERAEKLDGDCAVGLRHRGSGNFFYSFVCLFAFLWSVTRRCNSSDDLLRDAVQGSNVSAVPGKGRTVEIGLAAERQGVRLELTNLIRAPLLRRLF